MCSDVFADAAIRFIEGRAVAAFFAYLAFNAPHEPLVVPEADLEPYLGMVPYRGELGVGHPLPARVPAEETAKTYAMISNLDANVGRVLDRLDALGLAKGTIVVFLTDNGPWKPRFNAGMLDLKGNVHEGESASPCFVRWSGRPRTTAGSSSPSPRAFDLRNCRPSIEACRRRPGGSEVKPSTVGAPPAASSGARRLLARHRTTSISSGIGATSPSPGGRSHGRSRTLPAGFSREDRAGGDASLAPFRTG